MKHLFISWVTGTIHNDVRGQENKICHCFQFSLTSCHEVMGLDAMIIFWRLSFKSAFSLSSFTSLRGSLITLHFLPLEWYHLHIWDSWLYSQQSCFQVVIHPSWHLTWCTRHGCHCLFAQSCLTLCDPMDCSNPGFLSSTISQSLLKCMATELVMPSKHLILSSPSLSAFHLSKPQGFFRWVSASH